MTRASLESRFQKPPAADLLAVGGLLLIVLILWLPFGFAVPFWADSWGIQVAVDQGVVFSPEQARPLAAVPFAAAHGLSPNLFVGENVLLAALLSGKVWLVYAILKRLTHHRALAFAVAILVAVFPADTAVFNLGTLNIHAAVFMYVLAVCLLVVYWQGRRWYVLPLMGLALLVTLGIYEASYPLVVCTPLILVWLEKRVSRRVLLVSLLWYAVPAIMVARLVILSRQDQAAIVYQSGLYTGIAPQDALESIARVYAIHFWDGWRRSWDAFYPAYGVLAGIVAGAIGWRLARIESAVGTRTLLGLALGGFVMIALGYAPYLPTALRTHTDRTFFFSSLGGALVIAAVFLVVAQRFPPKHLIYAGLTAGVVGLGMTMLLGQHQTYAARGMAQIPVLRAFVRLAPAVEADTLLLVIDDSDDHVLGTIFVLTSQYLENALQLVYHASGLHAVICYPHDDSEWGILRERCQLETDRVVDTADGAVFRERTYDRVIAFRYQPEGTLTLAENLAPEVIDAVDYNPYLLFDAAATPPARYSILLGGDQ